MVDETTNDPSQTGQGESEPSSQVAPKEEKLILGKFKSVEDLEKSYKELETKMGGHVKTEAELKELRDFRDQVAPFLIFATQDTETVEKYKKSFGTSEDKAIKKDAPSSGESQAITEVALATEGRIISDFEKEHGFDGLTDEDKTSLRQTMGKFMGGWLSGTGRTRPSLTELPNFLEQAYTLAGAEKMRKRAKDEGAAEAYNAQLANGGVFSSAPARKTNKIELSADERKIAKKMGLTDEQYLKGKEAVSKSRNPEE